MSLPKQVQEAKERSDRILAERQQQGTEPATSEQPAREDAETQPVAAQEAPQEAPPQQQEKTDWKARYNVLQGKYNAEVPRYAAEVRELNKQLAEANQQIAKLQQELQQKADVVSQGESKPKGAAEDLRRLQEEYGIDVAEAIDRLASNRAKELVEPLQSKVSAAEAEREQRRQQDEARQKSVAFADAVNDLVPDWESIDGLPEFHEYLAEQGGDGRTRQEALMEAAGRFDAAGAARIFAAFKRTEAYKSRQASVAPAGARDALAARVVPESSGRDRAPDTGGKVYTRAEIAAFYRDLATGRVSPDRAKQIEKDIDAAMREGRVR